MAEVIKTVENVDKLFSQIVVNGEVYESDRFVPVAKTTSKVTTVTKNGNGETTSSVKTSSTRTVSVPQRAVQGEDVHAVALNDVLHNFVDQVVTEGLANEITARQEADQTLQNNISTINDLIPVQASPSNKLADRASVDSSIGTAISDLDVAQSGGNGKYIKAISETDGKISATEGIIDSSVISGSDNPVTGGAVASAISPVQASVSDIEALIPSQATTQNQLADKDFVNSSIATNTANFLGTYTSLADIEAIQNPTNNDYAFLRTTDQAGNSVFDRYKYNAEQSEWLFEYELNNSSFTAEQWATINSGLTSSSVSDAINALDVAQAGGAGKYIKAISETDGKISATEGTIDSSVTSGSTNPVTGGAVSTAITNAINALDVSDTAVIGQFVIQVSETNGKISVARRAPQLASTSQTGVVQLNDTLTSDSTTQALTAKQGKALNTAIGNKMDKTNPTGTGYFSLNRKANTIVGSYSFAEGTNGTASGIGSHVEGDTCTASQNDAHAEGYGCTASGIYSHAEGANSTASELCAHAEGDSCTASGTFSHAEGTNCIASGIYGSHAEGDHTEAKGTTQHVQGQYNVVDNSSTYADIIGNGDSTTRKNIEATTWTGDKRLKGTMYVNCNDDSTGGTEVKTKQTAVSDPTASGTGITFIDTISQNTNGVITPHKRTVRSATTSQTGVVQLNSTVTSTSTSQASTASAVKTAYDQANKIAYPDLSTKTTIEIVPVGQSGPYHSPWTATKNCFIVGLSSGVNTNYNILIDDVASSINAIAVSNNQRVLEGVPYPIKKGQVIKCASLIPAVGIIICDVARG